MSADNEGGSGGQSGEGADRRPPPKPSEAKPAAPKLEEVLARPVPNAALDALKEKFGEAVEEISYWAGEATTRVSAGRILDICLFLRDDSRTRMNLLSDLCAVDYPKDEVVRVDAREAAKGYFNEGGWRVGVGPDQPGAALLVLRLKGSDEIRTGELRLGASRDEQARAGCTEPAPWARPNSVGEAELDGVAFTTFQGGDAAMNHSRQVHAWRALRDGTCFAIDLVVQGSIGQVYDPPREAPFSETRAFNDLNGLLGGIHFMDATALH